MSEQRFTDIEIRMAYLENSVQTLDKVIQELGDTLDRTRRELNAVKEAMTSYSSGKENLSSTEQMLQDKPPHY